ncbi:hypothetical protein HHK36_026952 [Tetracentron sinense]|uniref:Gnk2-homologous domain-containing protein n=1 Tax=Tetracentron sinense TaxID=13715 RepID=A0A834YJM5_TETSI|nr:hypothetical protein HHK36_026952 [Tetracentron sinense]
MGLSINPFFLLSLTLVFLSGFELLPYVKTASDYSTLVYKGCANQTFTDPTGVYSQTLSALFTSLISQSSKSKFFKTTSGGGQTTITGLFQCRGDLSNADCYNCVTKLPEMSNSLCGKTIAARIQLNGCYILYEISGFPQISGVELLYKTCSRSQAVGSGFEERRDTGFSAVESGMVSGNGFYTTSYESVYVLAQCEGDLGTGDCGECVKSAVQRAQVECGSSISGQIYLHKCYMSYNYYPNGVSRKSFSGRTGQNTGKTVAVVMGGAAAVGFGVVCLMFARSVMKKREVYPKVKVREQAQDDQIVAREKEESSSLLLEILESLSLQDRCSPGFSSVTDSAKEYQNDSPPSVARIPESYIPNLAMPLISGSKGAGKNNKESKDDTRPNIGSSSVLRPRAVLSSPDNDGMIGSKNKLTRERPSALKNNNLGQSSPAQCKVMPRRVIAESPVKTRRVSKEAADDNGNLKEKKGPELTVRRQKACLRRGKPSSSGI